MTMMLNSVTLGKFFATVKLKGYSGFKNLFSRLYFFGFNMIFDHMRVHVLALWLIAK